MVNGNSVWITELHWYMAYPTHYILRKENKMKSNYEISKQIRNEWPVSPVTKVIPDKKKKKEQDRQRAKRQITYHLMEG
jgi:hypothetical protein